MGFLHKILKKTFNNVITVIIPRHIHRTKKIYLDLKKTGLSVQIKNEKQKIDKYLVNLDRIFKRSAIHDPVSIDELKKTIIYISENDSASGSVLNVDNGYF